MSFWKWSKTAASNATADDTVNAREGMAPAAVNDSMRAMMAAAAKYRDDISGSIETGGSSTAYTVTTNQVLASLTSGFAVAFRPHATNGAGPVTLNVDSLGAKPLRGQTGVALPAGYLVAGTPYRATYFSSADEWLLEGFYGDPYGVPIGGCMPYVSETPPNSNFVLPYGQALSRTTYATLFDRCGTTYGVGDGSTTFNVPDVRGRNIVGLDDMGGSAANRVTSAVSGIDGGAVGAVGGAQSVTLERANLPNVTLGMTTAGAHTHTVTIKQNAGFLAGGADVSKVLVDTTSSGTETDQTTPPTSSSNGDHAHTTDSMNGNVTQTVVNKMPPSIVLPILLRVI